MSTVTAALKTLRETDFLYKILILIVLIGALLTAHTTAGLCYILAQTLWRYVVYHGRAFIAYCKHPFANFVKTCVQMTIAMAAITVNMLTLWASAFAAEVTEKQLEKHADTDVHNRSIGWLRAINNLLSIAVAITSIGYCMHMLASNNPFVGGAWQFACGISLFAQGLMAIRISVIQWILSDQPGAVSSANLSAAYEHSIIHLSPSYRRLPRHWSCWGAIDGFIIFASAYILSTCLPLRYLLPLQFLIGLSDRMVRLHIQAGQCVYSFIKALVNVLWQFRQTSALTRADRLQRWQDLRTSFFACLIPAANLAALYVGVSYYTGLLLPHMAYTAVTGSIAVLSLVLRFDLLIKIVMLILPSITYRPLVLILGMIDGKDSRFATWVCAFLQISDEQTKKRTREIVIQFLSSCLMLSFVTWYVPALFFGSIDLIPWFPGVAEAARHCMLWSIIKLSGDAVVLALSSRLRRSRQWQSWSNLVERSAGWSVLLSFLARDKEIVTRRYAVRFYFHLHRMWHLCGLAWLCRQLMGVLNALGIMSLLRGIGQIIHALYIDRPVLWLLGLWSRHTLNQVLIVCIASVSTAATILCLDKIRALPWRATAKTCAQHLARLLEPFVYAAWIITGLMVIVMLLWSLFQISQMSLVQLLSPVMIMKIVAQVLCVCGFVYMLNGLTKMVESNMKKQQPKRVVKSDNQIGGQGPYSQINRHQSHDDEDDDDFGNDRTPLIGANRYPHASAPELPSTHWNHYSGASAPELPSIHGSRIVNASSIELPSHSEDRYHNAPAPTQEEEDHDEGTPLLPRFSKYN
jgi:hypothetical protein